MIESKLEQKEEVKPDLPVITIDENGAVKTSTLEGGLRYASMLVKSNMLPKHYDTPAKVMAAMQMANNLGLPPVIALKNICVINGSPAIWGDLPLGLVRKSKQLEWISEVFYDSKGEEIGPFSKEKPFIAVCEVKRKGSPKTTKTWFSLDDAKQAGLLGKSGPWTTYTRRMLKLRARGECLKDCFPDILQGLDIAEYTHNYMPTESVDVTPEGVDKTAILENYKKIIGDISGKTNETIQEN